MIVTSKTPKLDLHNEIGSIAPVLINEFIRYHFLLYDEIVVIIHGKSGHVIKNVVYETLKNNGYVKSFKLDSQNIGQTIVEINKRTK